MEVRTSAKGQAKHDQGLRTSTSGTMTKPPGSRTIGWKPGCDCHESAEPSEPPAVPLEPIPCTVLDPFSGAGTVGVVCEKLQRKYIGIELNPEYVAMANRRVGNVAPLFAQDEP